MFFLVADDNDDNARCNDDMITINHQQEVVGVISISIV